MDSSYGCFMVLLLYNIQYIDWDLNKVAEDHHMLEGRITESFTDFQVGDSIKQSFSDHVPALSTKPEQAQPDYVNMEMVKCVIK
jgi:hypothetical protein